METTHANASTGSAGRFKNANLVQAWLVLLLALLFGSALAAVQVRLSDTIAANKVKETLAQVPGLIWGENPTDQPTEAVRITPGTLAVEKAGKSTSYNLYRAVHNDRTAGWVVKASGQGYADKLELLIGVDADVQTITGLFVLEQKETPGLGNKIIFADWRNQFIGKKTDTPLAVTKGGNPGAYGIDAITGATISSRSVTNIVNTTIGDLKGRLDAQGTKFSERPSP